MNYYKRHLGDYAKDTRHLSLLEHGAFCLLLDYYYSTEKPIPDDRCERIANAYETHERNAVRSVLEAFFTLTDEGWRNARADEEIAAFHGKSLKAKESAEKRWSERNAKAYANASKTQCDGNASHKPLAINQKEQEKPRTGRAKSVTLADWIDALEGGDAVPADDPIFDWAGKVGLPREWIALAWWAFEGRYTGDGQGAAKTYTDWRATFRNAVREDWLKLWRMGPDGYLLTTAGQQAQREMRA